MNKILFRWLWLILFQAGSVVLYAQGTIVTGTVKVNKSEPAPYASVAFYDSASQRLITGTACDSLGKFDVKIKPGIYKIKISFLAFRPSLQNIKVSGVKMISLGEIILTPVAGQLKEITIKGEISQMELTFEKRVFTVGKDITSMGGSVLDVLNNVPSLSADLKGNISLRGNNQVRVLINGRPSKIYRNGSLALQSLPAELIKKIEIITNPSAKYEPEGSAGIINIILKKNSEIGFHGNAGLMQRSPEASEVTTNLNYHRGVINWFFSGSFSYNADPSFQRTFQRFSSKDTSYIYRELNNGVETDFHGDYQAGQDINITSHQKLTISDLFHFENKNDFWNGYYFDSTYSGIFLDQIKIYNRIGGGERANEASLDYENDFNGSNHKLTAQAEFDYGKERELPHIQEVNLQQVSDTSFHEVRDIRMNRYLNLRVDYVHPVLDSGKVETGIRGIYNLQNYFYLARARSTGEWQILPQFNNNYLATENQAAGYATLSSGIGPLLYQLGLRAEYYRINTSLKNTLKSSGQSYLSFFPSIFLTYKFKSHRSVQLSYSRRISRPGARELLPATDYSSSRDRYTGNPDLKPEYNNSYDGQFLQDWESGSFLFSIYYRHRTGVIQQIMSLDSTGIMRRTPFNLAVANAWGLEFSLEKDFGDNFKFTAGSNFYNYRSNGNYEGKAYTILTDRLTGLLKFDWTLFSRLKLQAALRYFGPSNTLQGRRSSFSYINMALARDIFHGNGTLSLNSEDLLTSRVEKFTVTGQDFYSQQRYWEPSGIRLNFIYRFNEKKKEDEEE